MSRLALLFIGLLFIASHVQAQDGQNTAYFVNQVVGSPIADNSSFLVANDQYVDSTSWQAIDSFRYVDNRIIFRLDEMADTSEVVDCQFTATIRVNIWRGQDNPSGPPSDGFITDLVIDYQLNDTTGVSPVAAYTTFTGGQQMEVEVLRIEVSGDSLPETMPQMRIVGEMAMAMAMSFNCDTIPTVLYDSIPYADVADLRHRISWSGIDGATSYDLEYVFYHYESEVGQWLASGDPTVYGSFDWLFRHNATRINTNSTEYFLTEAYPEGHLFYRLRGVNRDANNAYIFTRWSTTGQSGTLSSFPQRIDLNWFESDYNWQFSSSFAEEGKRMMSVNYFDGSQRLRQSRTRFGQKQVLGSSGNYIVSNGSERLLSTQTIYDQHGRAVIETIPSPRIDRTRGLEYFTLLAESSNTAGQPYSKSDFLTGDCNPAPDSLANTNGVGRYFSQNSSTAPRETPDAQGYPFSMVEFTPDATGRVRRQSGVGPHLMLGSGRESSYFYGKPAQQELDRLFGNNVGLAQHYEKHMVIDPNGQASVSYLDAKGRTIATALAGTVPANVTALNEAEVTESLSTTYNSIFNIPENQSLVSYSSLLVPENTSLSLTYLLEDIPQMLSDCAEDTACYECKYDLVIEISDDCGNSFNTANPGQPLVLVDSNYVVGNLDLTCPNPQADLSLNQSGIQLTPGEYKITKRLSLSATQFDEYVNYYVDHLTSDTSSSACLPSIEDIVQQYQDSLVLQCDVDICSYQDIKEQDFIAQAFGLSPTAEETALGQQMFAELQDNIDRFCRTNNPCELYRRTLYTDLLPGAQYARYETISGAYSATTFPHSVLNTSATINFTTVDFGGDSVQVVRNGSVEQLPVNQLTLTEFITNFRESWLQPLAAAFHPEWCLVEELCADTILNNYDELLWNVDTYQEALNAGLINQMGQFNWDSLTIELGDPYFLTGGPGAAYRQQIIDYMNNITDTVITGVPEAEVSAVEMVVRIVYGEGGTLGQGPAYADDEAWRLLRQFYISQKRQMQRLVILDQIANNTVCGGGTIDARLVDLYTDVLILGTADTAQIRLFPPVLEDRNYSTVVDDPTNSNDPYDQLEAALQTELEGTLTDNCTSSCNLTIDNIFAEFADCGIAVADSITLRTELLEICLAGCDFQHPNGAITPDSTFTPAPTYGSFAEAITAIVGFMPNDTTECTPFVNTGLPPHERLPYYGPVTTRYIDPLNEEDCWQDKLATIQSVVTFNFPSAVDSALLVYFNRHPDVLMTQEELDALQAIMDTSYSSNVFPVTVTIPPHLECNVCIDCKDFTDLRDSVPTFTGVSDLERDILQARYYNYQLGWNLSAEQYAQFALDCGLSGPATPSSELIGPPLLCPESAFPEVDKPCFEDIVLPLIQQQATLDYQDSLASLREDFVDTYLATCLSGLTESFSRSINYTEYHYTLYYYDQAGNLVQTVPPEGISRLDATGIQDVVAHRQDPGSNSPVYPGHDMITTYQYNSLNAVVYKTCPDQDDPVETWYDRLGRVVVSQDGRQQSQNLYSYTVYDYLGRVVEVGEKESLTGMTISTALDPQLLANWIAAGSNATKTHVTRTYYNAYVTAIPDVSLTGDILRNRVASVTFEELNDSDSTTYDYATHYQYDIAGNVELLVQDFPKLTSISNRYKTVAYEYDLISGNVHAVKYQEGELDQFTHRYEYDDENRLVNVHTSTAETMHSNSGLWDQDALYEYYPHGPLKRSELGELKVQGCDYAYTIQGWIKGLNADNIREAEYDPGYDGGPAATYVGFDPDPFDTIPPPIFEFLGSQVAKDVFGYSLSYFDGDYTPLSTTFFGTSVAMPIAGSSLAAANTGLYNGNIRHMVTSHSKHKDGLSQAYTYEYDQLHRLLGQHAYELRNAGTFDWNGNERDLGNQFKTSYTYDPNGNILSLDRHAKTTSGVTILDDLAYTYSNLADGRRANRLTSVVDNVNAADNAVFPGDFEGTNTYAYDGAGNLIHSVNTAQSQNDSITWSPYGKVLSVVSNNDSARTDFDYDASQNRVRKRYTNADGATVDTYYVRDAQGNVLATYEHSHPTQALNWQEQYLYGSSRLGHYTSGVQVGVGIPEGAGSGPTCTDGVQNGDETGIDCGGAYCPPCYDYTSDFTFSNGVHLERFNFSNWEDEWEGISSGASLANGTQFACSGGPATFAVQLDTSEYIQTDPSQLDLSVATDLRVRFCFNTNLSVNGDYLALQVSHDNGASFSTVRTWVHGTDFGFVPVNDLTLTAIVPGPFNANSKLKFFHPASNQTANAAVYIDNIDLDNGTIDYCNDGIQNNGENGIDCGGSCDPCPQEFVRGNKRYELTNHLGNVMATVSDRVVSFNNDDPQDPQYRAYIRSSQDYYPFGLRMQDRQFEWQFDNYRFGFNGKERDKDGEWGAQTHYDYGFRIYNPSIARFLSVDPLAPDYPWYTPYQFAGNKPIYAIDLDGLEEAPAPMLLFRGRLPVLRAPTPSVPSAVRDFRQYAPWNSRNPSALDIHPIILAEIEETREKTWYFQETQLYSEDRNISSGQSIDGSYPIWGNNPPEFLLEEDTFENSIKRFKKDNAYIRDIQEKQANGQFLTIEEQNDLNKFYGSGKSMSRGNKEYFGRQGVYAIYIDGELYKIGKAHLEGKLDSRGRPYRLLKQIKDLQSEYPNSIIDGDVIKDFMGTTEEAESLELELIKLNNIPKGNENDRRLPRK